MQKQSKLSISLSKYSDYGCRRTMWMQMCRWKKHMAICMRIIEVNRNRSEHSSMCHTMFSFLFNIFFQFSVFCSCLSTSKFPLFIYFYFSYIFIFHKTERNSAAHEPSCLCLPFHLSMLSAWLIYGHLFWQTRTRCRTRSETTSEQL